MTSDPRTSGNSFSRSAGTYLYPTDNATYANNAADLVELRVEPLATSTAFRLTLNTIKDSRVLGATIAIGGSAGGPLHAWPYSANVRSPAQYFLTVHGTATAGAVTADLRDAVSGLPVIGTAPTAALDMTRRQVTVTVPHSTWNPGTGIWRMAAGVGLWNAATSLYRVPTQNPTATQPGGAQLVGSPPALFNLAFRDECQQKDPVPPTPAVPAGCEPMPNVQHPNALANASWWRDHAQAAVLGSGTLLATPDISPFFANVDFSKLAGAVNDETNVPQTGPMNRILASHFESEQGAIYSESCSTTANTCKGWLRGQLQPYAIYVPPEPMPGDGYGLTLLLHSLGANYNQFLGSANQTQFGDRGPGSIVITAAGRGPDGWYYGDAASDTFEMWADTAARYTLDPEWTVISGYSMGGYATYKLGSQFPDLFAKGQPVVGPPAQGVWLPPAPPTGGEASNTNRMLASFRNIPFLIWNGAVDELVPLASAAAQVAEFRALGLRYEWDLFPASDHFALAINDEYGEAADFLGTTEVDRNPPHVTYVRNPTMDYATGQLTADHAYWLSGITLSDSSGSAPIGTIDVRSHGFGVGDPTPSGATGGAGVLLGGQAPFAYVCESQSWGPSAPVGTCETGTTAGPATPIQDELDITATNISEITVNARRARVTCDAQKNITSDGPITVHMVDCPEDDDYARPGSATPLRVPLVNEYSECTSPNSEHVAPLDLDSCTPVSPESSLLTTSSVGRASGFARLDAQVGDPGTPADEADLQVEAHMTDVRQASGGSDYSGQVILSTRIRITDLQNGAGGNAAGTTSDAELSIPISCTPTPGDPGRGSNCDVSTTLDTLVPGAMVEGARSIIPTFSVNVKDLGADDDLDPSPDPLGLGCPPTCGSGDEKVFLRQGVFTP